MAKFCPVLSMLVPYGENYIDCLENLCGWWSIQREWEENRVKVIKPAQCAVLEQKEND